MDIITMAKLTYAYYLDAYNSLNIGGLYEKLQYLMKIENKDVVIVDTIYAHFVNWGFYLLLIYGLLEAYELFSREHAVEQIVKLFFKFGLGIAILEHGGLILGSIASLGNVAIDKIVNETKLLEIKWATLEEAVVDMGFMTALTLMLPVSLFWILAKIANAVIAIQLWTRKIEMLARMAFASIAVADVYGEVTRSNGIRYLKKLLALALQGVAIVAIFAIVSKQQQNLVSTLTLGFDITNTANFLSVMTNVLDLGVLLFVVIGCISVSKQVVNDALGV